jgi:hypothetical protein
VHRFKTFRTILAVVNRHVLDIVLTVVLNEPPDARSTRDVGVDVSEILKLSGRADCAIEGIACHECSAGRTKLAVGVSRADVGFPGWTLDTIAYVVVLGFVASIVSQKSTRCTCAAGYTDADAGVLEPATIANITLGDFGHKLFPRGAILAVIS